MLEINSEITSNFPSLLQKKIFSSRYGSIASANYTNVQCSNEDYLVLFQCSFTRASNGCNRDQAVTVNCGM